MPSSPWTVPHMANVLLVSTLGSGSREEARLRELFRNFAVELFPFDRARKRQMFWQLQRRIAVARPDLVAMEGTGLAGGLALLLGRLRGVPYVVSSGDAVGPWVGAHVQWAGPLFGLYERLLCRGAAGYIGWTPYLVGRALTFGTPRGVTAAGWAPFTRTVEELSAARVRVRERLGIPAGALVLGIAGSMVWNARTVSCYGSEIVEALRRVARPDAYGLLVGDGTGLARVRALAAGLPAGRVVFTGRVPPDEVPDYLAAMDLGSLPQSVDRCGGFRYTTKISEYLAAGLPVVTNAVPMGYDLDDGWVVRVPGPAPWHPTALAGLATLLDGITPARLAELRAAVPRDSPLFDRERQVAHVTAFVRELLAERGVSA